MNGYELTRRLKQIRAGTYLSAIDQVLFHELILICNQKRWQPVFHVCTAEICQSLNLSDRTISHARRRIAAAGLISFQTCKDKRIGCYYSFDGRLSNDGLPRPATSELASPVPIPSSEPSPENPSPERPLSPIIYDKTKNSNRKDMKYEKSTNQPGELPAGTAAQRKESVGKLADLATGILQSIAAQRNK